MIVANDPSSTVLEGQLRVEVLSNFFCEIFVIEKDKDMRLSVEVEGLLNEAYVVSWIFDASVYLVGRIHGVGAI